jgi:hypothetical protein
MLKQTLKTVDRKILNKGVSRSILKYQQTIMRQKLKRENFHTFEVFYTKNQKDSLAELFDIHGSDKGSNKSTGHVFDWDPKSYSDIYSLLFESKKLKIKRVFECGIGTNNPLFPSSMGERGKPGASLRAWRDYFPNSEIFGADIDKSILFQEQRIRTGYINQLDQASIQQFLKEFDLKDIDIVIDDGLHTFEAAINLFEVVLHKLTYEGIYIIEDIHPKEIEKFVKYFNNKSLRVNYVIFKGRNKIPVGSLIWIYGTDIKAGQHSQ